MADRGTAHFQITYSKDAFEWFYAQIPNLVAHTLCVEVNGEPMQLHSLDYDTDMGITEDVGAIMQVRDIDQLTPPRPFPLYDQNGEPTITSIYVI